MPNKLHISSQELPLDKLNAYLEGRLSAKEKAAVEKLIDENDLYADSLSELQHTGFAASSTSIANITNKIDRRTNPTLLSGKNMAIAASFLTIIGIGIYFLLSDKPVAENANSTQVLFVDTSDEKSPVEEKEEVIKAIIGDSIFENHPEKGELLESSIIKAPKKPQDEAVKETLVIDSSIFERLQTAHVEVDTATTNYSDDNEAQPIHTLDKAREEVIIDRGFVSREMLEVAEDNFWVENPVQEARKRDRDELKLLQKAATQLPKSPKAALATLTEIDTKNEDIAATDTWYKATAHLQLNNKYLAITELTKLATYSNIYQKEAIDKLNKTEETDLLIADALIFSDIEFWLPNGIIVEELYVHERTSISNLNKTKTVNRTGSKPKSMYYGDAKKSFKEKPKSGNKHELTNTENVLAEQKLLDCRKYLEEGNSALAIETLERMPETENSTFLQTASWYEGIAYLMKGDNKVARLAFIKIADEQGIYQSKAKDILSNIQ